MKRLLGVLRHNQKGQIMPIVLVTLVVGSLLIPASLVLVSTHLKVGNALTENVKGVYAADAGIEDAIWRSVTDPNFLASSNAAPYQYQLANPPNGMNVLVEVSNLYMVPDIMLPDMGGHYTKVGLDEAHPENWPTATYDLGDLLITGDEHYDFTITFENTTGPGVPTGQSGYKVDYVAIQIPRGIEYVPGTTKILISGAVATPISDSTMTIIGAPDSGYTLQWTFSPALNVPAWKDGDPVDFNEMVLTCNLQEIPGGKYSEEWREDGLVTFFALDVRRSDVGLVSNFRTSYRFKAIASNSRGVHATIVADVWSAPYLDSVYVRYWQVNPQ